MKDSFKLWYTNLSLQYTLFVDLAVTDVLRFYVLSLNLFLKWLHQLHLINNTSEQV